MVTAKLECAPVALVTGASRGLGRAVALELARRGFSVALGYRRDQQGAEAAAAQASALGVKAVALGADVSSAAEVERLFEQMDAALGPVTALACCAGITRDTLLASSEPQDFSAVMAVNLEGTANACRAAARRMVPLRRGSIVNVSSVAAQRPGRGQSNYAASKGAVEALSRALAVELGPRGIRVNAVAPGLIETDMSAAIRSLAGDEITRRILLRRAGSADEVARVIGFLCSDEASYVTGQVWGVDGGFKLE